MIHLGVIGLGYWGEKLVRVFQSIPDVQVVAACDLNPVRTNYIKETYPHIETYNEAERFFTMGGMSAVAIATPIDTHYDIAKEALHMGKHVFVEKPLATSLSEAERLVSDAERQNLTLAVGHVFIYHPAVVKIRELLDDEKSFGKILYFESTRAHLGGFHGGSNVIWDLGPHDVSILLDCLKVRYISLPSHISTAGVASLLDGVFNTVYCAMLFQPLDVIAHINWNWLSATKIRRIVIGCERKTIIYDDMDIFEKVKVYEAAVKLNRDFLGDQSIYHRGDVYAPEVSSEEPLLIECRNFINSIKRHVEPYSSGRKALDVIRVLERIEKSLTQGGWQ